MDNVTHTLVGLMLARVGLDRGEKGAAVMLMLAANAPDMDVVFGLTGSLKYLEIHRGYTHALPLAPLVALIPLLLVNLITRTRITLAAYLACLVAILSHLLLDWTNVYGIRLLMPFSSKWFRLDSTDIVDPLILLILLSALAAPALVSLVSSEIGSRKVSGPKRGWAWFALLALTAYDAGRWVVHERAVSVIDAHEYMGKPALRAYAFPERFSLLGWRGVVKGDGFYYEVPIDLSKNFDAETGQFDYLPGESAALNAARTTRSFQVFEGFNQVPFWRVSPVVDAMKVELIDLRFGTASHPGFEAIANVEQDGRVVDAHFTLGDPINPKR
jgi:inner membrane protein